MTKNLAAPVTVAPLLLDSRAAAKLLGISRAHFYKLYLSGRTPRPVRLGRSVRWRREELVAWLDAGCPSYDRWVALKGGKS